MPDSEAVLPFTHYGNQPRGFFKGGGGGGGGGGDNCDHPLCPFLQPGPPSQTLGGLGQRYWSVTFETWSFGGWGLQGPPA